MTGTLTEHEDVTRSDWDTTLGALCDRFGGGIQTGPFGSQLHASDYSEDGTPVVMPQDLVNGRIVTDRIARVPESVIRKLSRHALRFGDVVFSRRGDVTRFAVVTHGQEGWLCGTGCIRIRLNCPDVDIPFFRHYLLQNSIGNWLIHEAKGVTMANLNTEIVRALPFVYPPLSEQRRIAAILDEAEALRQKRRLANQKFDSLNLSIFLNIFGGPDQLNEHPTQPLDQFVRKGDRINYGVVQPGDDCEGGVPLVRVGDFTNGVFDFRNQKRIDPSIEASYKRSRLRGDEILVSCVGSIGTAAICTPDMKGMNIARAVARIPVDPGKINPIFLLAYLRTDFVQHYFRTELRTVNQPTLNIEQIAQTRISVPDRHRQDKFAETIQRLNALVSTAEISDKRLDRLFAAVQHRAFRGELVAPVFAV